MKRIVFLLSVSIVLIVLAIGCRSSKSKTVEGLKASVRLETQNGQKMLRFAEAAQKEGLDTLATLFRIVARADSVHAANHEKLLNNFWGSREEIEPAVVEIKTTADQLQQAIKIELNALQASYPAYIRAAEGELNPVIARTFNWAYESEKIQLGYFRTAAASLRNGHQKGIPDAWMVCPTCGNIIPANTTQTQCELCLTHQEQFIGYIPNPDGQ